MTVPLSVTNCREEVLGVPVGLRVEPLGVVMVSAEHHLRSEREDSTLP